MATIKLADPNIVNNPLNMGVPDYSKMFISIDLTAQRRESSILVDTGSKLTSSIDTTGPDLKVSLMGYDLERGYYSTNWTNNVGSSQTPYEGFGITNISITTNSSYVPVVNIDFLDVRGLSLFNEGSNSPYSVLHSFPPPIFNLRIKGFYGKALEYQLHLLKQDTDFDSESGNYTISTEYVARTFAPLTDVLFKYAQIVPLIDKPVSDTNVDPRTPPTNINDFIIKSKRLYEDIVDIKENSNEINEFNDVNSKLVQLREIKKNINNFPTGILPSNEVNQFIATSSLFMYAAPSIITQVPNYNEPVNIVFDPLNPFQNPVEQKPYVQNDDDSVIDIGNAIDLYDRYIQTNQTSASNSTDLPKKLILGIGTNNSNLSSASSILDRIKSILVDDLKNIIPNADENSILNTTFIFNNQNYVALDITKYYNLLKSQITSYENQLKKINEKIREKIDQSLIENLGAIPDGTGGTKSFKPTVKNVIKLICDDVDKFFAKMNDVASAAEGFNKANDSKIRSEFKTIKDDKIIHPLPTYVETRGYPQNGITRSEKTYLGKLGNRIGLAFPEVNFVEDFINAFIKIKKEERIQDLRNKTDAHGNNTWIPISSFDSALNGRNNLQSPYINKTTKDQIYQTLYDRFIVLSQYIFTNTFYENQGIFNLNIDSSELGKYLARAEAKNIANSIIDNQLISTIKNDADTYKTNIDGFYNFLNLRGIKLRNKDYININGINLYRKKTTPDTLENNDNKHIELFRESLVERVSNSNDQNSIVDDFIDNAADNGFLKSIFGNSKKVKKFTKENVVYYPDRDPQTDYYSDYLLSSVSDIDERKSIRITFNYALASDDISIKNIINNNTFNDYIKSFWLSSIFGNYILTGAANEVTYWGYPSVIELPYSVIVFLGGLIYFYKDTPDRTTIINNFYEYIRSNNINSSGMIRAFPSLDYLDILDDIIDPLSKNDKELLKSEFVKFTTTPEKYQTLRNAILDTINNNINKNSDTSIFSGFESTDKYKAYKNDLNLTTFKRDIFELLVDKRNLLIYGENTFVKQTENYKDISEVNLNSDKKIFNDRFFLHFLSELSSSLEQAKDELSNIENQFTTSIDDNDIKNQMYYSFQSIYDKWIAGNGQNTHFPLSNGPLIDQFKFIDRAFNDIGDVCIIDFQPIIDSSENYDESVFSTISRLLAHNGFEFFPLQNFMSFQDGEWDDVFKTDDTDTVTATPAFVCMYVGGTSSILNDPLSDYKDDGVDFNKDVPDDFTANIATQDGFKPRAFRVAFSQQNQSFFTNIKLDTSTHQETNESLQILSKIAQDNSSKVPIGKAQNLFETYENRSYSCTVSMLGNVMIQPTQYFQLENIPMFSGGYLILSVTHNIKPNFMETTFQGVRIPKYPVPFVTEFATAVGIQGSTADDITDNVGKANSSNNFGGNNTDFRNLKIPVSASGLLLSP